MKRIRTKRGVTKTYNAIVRKLYKDNGYVAYGWDMPTLSIVFPFIYRKIIILKRLYKMLPA
jgi:hypothetical protein